jgi:hypothetical protein
MFLGALLPAQSALAAFSFLPFNSLLGAVWPYLPGAFRK